MTSKMVCEERVRDDRHSFSTGTTETTCEQPVLGEEEGSRNHSTAARGSATVHLDHAINLMSGK